MKNLIAFVGFQSSGKNTAAEALRIYGYQPISFADALKDALAAIFCWPRHLLEGITPESRAWRETVDPWWGAKLNISNFTPRFAMQNVGTEVMRHQFHDQLWVLNVERRLTQMTNQLVVVSDARYPNEIDLVRQFGGHIERIKRGDDPWWVEYACTAFNAATLDRRKDLLRRLGAIVHDSEWAWLESTYDGTTINDGSVDELHDKIVKKFISGGLSSRQPVSLASQHADEHLPDH